MKKSRGRLQQSTNQIGKGDGVPNFELVRPPDDNFFQLEVIQSRSFKQSKAAREITYRAKLKNPSDEVPLNNLISHLHALFETILEETKREYGDEGLMRIYISHPKLEKSIIIYAAVVEILSGSGRKAIIDIHNDLLCKKSIVKIRNTDYSCLPRAIVNNIIIITFILIKLIYNETRLVDFFYNNDRKRTIPENCTFCLPWQWDALKIKNKK